MATGLRVGGARSRPSLARRRVNDARPIESTRFVARLHIEQGHAVPGRDVLGELIELADALDDVGEKARAEAAAAQLLMLMGDEAAVEWAERAIAHGTAAGDERVVVQARVEGLLLLAENRAADAVVAFAATMEAAGECLRRPTEASLRLAYAQAMLAAGDRAGALAECRRAREQLAR